MGRNNDITKVAYGNGLYLGITSGGLGWSSKLDGIGMISQQMN